MKTLRTAAVGLLAMAGYAHGQDRIDDTIALIDIRGEIVHPFDARGKAASILFFITVDCPISNLYAREIHRICDAYSSQASCLLDYVDPALNESKIEKHMTSYGHGRYPAVIDKNHALVKAAGATVTPEAAVIAGSRIVYRGRIDNLYIRLGQARPKPTQFDLRSAIDAVIAGRTIDTPQTQAIGCSITPMELLGKIQ